jgi:hypothetical protein
MVACDWFCSDGRRRIRVYRTSAGDLRKTFASAKGRRYRIIGTTEEDPRDPPDDDEGDAR